MKKKTRVVHCKKQPFDILIDRTTIWGNPFEIGKDGSREQVIEKYRKRLMKSPKLIELAKQKLKGKVLGCWCSPLPCHGDILVEVCDG